MEKQEVKTYENDEIVVYWKPWLCQHAAKCVHGNPKVFEVGRRPWIKLEEAPSEEIMKIIDTCPSGALSYLKK